MANHHREETYRSLITLSIDGFKFSALVNGGASVALLAYLGNIAGKGIQAPDMRVPMAFFLAGLLTCGLARVFSYFTQLKLLNEIGSSREPRVSHCWFLWIAIALYLSSLVTFGVGSWQAVISFR